jgi:hypothetical protein
MCDCPYGSNNFVSNLNYLVGFQAFTDSWIYRLQQQIKVVPRWTVLQ